MRLFRDSSSCLLIYVCPGVPATFTRVTPRVLPRCYASCALPTAGNYARSPVGMKRVRCTLPPPVGPLSSLSGYVPLWKLPGISFRLYTGAFQSTSTPTSLLPALWRLLLFGQESPGLHFGSQHLPASRRFRVCFIAAILLWTRHPELKEKMLFFCCLLFSSLYFSLLLLIVFITPQAGELTSN
jgi:hypothetical protein